MSNPAANTLNRKKLFIGLSVFIIVIVLADQLVKLLVAERIPFGDTAPFIPGILRLTHLRNTGAAFSMLPGGRWLFLGITVLYFAALPFLIRKKIISRPFEYWCFAAISGGALGNLIDRLRFGYVVDMFEAEFVDFAVFNVADSFITCGGIALLIYVLFAARRKPNKEQTDEADQP